MNARGRFPRGTEFPHEGFVQHAIERYFVALGYRISPRSYVDLFCAHPGTKVAWIVEAKGMTTAVGLDFRTGLGQLLQQIQDETTNHGMAVPDVPQFIAQCQRVSPLVRRKLRLHWLIVAADGNVQVIGPAEQV
jgi:hypothetical protein